MARYIIDLSYLRRQAAAARANADRLGVRLYFAVKSCPLPAIFPVLADYVEGVTASGLYEARLSAMMGKAVHVHSPAYQPEEIPELAGLCSTVVFNSFRQYDCLALEVIRAGKQAALRIHPGFSASVSWKYDPCGEFSRYGEKLSEQTAADIARRGIRQLHLHALNGADGEQFAALLEHLAAACRRLAITCDSINLGGGMKISEPDFVTPRAIAAVTELKCVTGAELLIEPSEYVLCDAGAVEATVLDIIDRGAKSVAILDCSAICHFPDVTNMPYVPDILLPETAENPDTKPTILTGNSCLSADVIGEYGFASPLHVGDRILFGGMAAYSFCQATWFNGLKRPDIVLRHEDGTETTALHCGYDNYLQSCLLG